MSKFGVSQSPLRKEDVRFLKGEGRYIDDTPPEGAAYMVFLRSPVAHGTIAELDVSDARDMDGVLAVYTFDDTKGKLDNSIDFSAVTNQDGSKAATPRRVIIAEDRVRFVGEIVAAVVAESKAQALDAAEAIMLDIDELPVHLDLAPGGEALHAEAPDNLVFDWAYGDKAATDAIFAGAAHTVRLDLIDNRVIANPMEPRGCWSAMEGDRLHHSVNGQGVWGAKGEIAAKLGMAPEDVRVTNPDVGGGFGMKAFNYPEQFLVSLAAKGLNRPVRWIAERGEGMLTDNGGRDLVTVAEAAFDENHVLQSVRIQSSANMGAYCSTFAQFIQTDLALKVLTGVYDIQTVWFEVQGYFTNTCPVDAYRGAGRPEAIYVMERLMDYSAKQLGVDALDLRRKSFIPKEKFPYTSASGELYDVGDFHRVLDRAVKEADVAGFAARKAESAANGKLRGIGLSYYIESILGDQNETTKIEFAEDGMVNLYVGTQSNGQGHETVFAQILHARTGIPFDQIRFVQGDSDRIAKGGGTGGSRSVTMQGNSINATSDEMISRFRPLAEDELEVASVDINFEDGAFRVAGTDKAVTLMALADKARKAGKVELLVVRPRTPCRAAPTPTARISRKWRSIPKPAPPNASSTRWWTISAC